VLNITET